jgi:S-adenosylmethionine-dependent methyltransferase
MAQWTQEQRAPWSVLKYNLTQANLRRHLSAGQALRVLDVGGGNGLDAIPLAREGHHVAIVDFSSEMLAAAQQSAAADGLHERIAVYCAEALHVPELFPDQLFDVVLCHNVLQYVADVPALLQAICTPLKPDGLVSLISVNRYSVAYQAAFFRGDLAGAVAALDRRHVEATVFGMPMTLYSGEEIAALLPQIGCALDHYYGIRCICDYWGDNERKSDRAIFSQLEQLELALTDKHPYNLLARYFQLIAHKLT